MLRNWQTSPVIQKREAPVLTYKDIPYHATCIFNAGVVKYEGKYVMVFRNDAGTFGKCGLKTSLGIAYSDDGVHFTVEPNLFMEDIKDDEILSVYDPRITLVDGVPHVCLAMNTWHGLRGVIVKTPDFAHYDVVTMTAPDNRNMVLFPEKVGGNYVRLERPFTVYSRGGKDRFDIWASRSPDLKYWGDSELVMGVEHVPFANDKIGPAAPPIKTKYGWLTTFHAVDRELGRGKNGWEPSWDKRYTAGIMLLDLDDPTKVIGMSKQPLIAPELPFETDEGFRQNVIFPGGMILEDDETVKIYYGASDTVECLATASLSDLVALCTEKL